MTGIDSNRSLGSIEKQQQHSAMSGRSSPMIRRPHAAPSGLAFAAVHGESILNLSGTIIRSGFR